MAKMTAVTAPKATQPPHYLNQPDCLHPGIDRALDLGGARS